MRAAQMELKRVLVLIDATAVLALGTLLVLVLCFDMSVYTRSVDRLITIRALNVRGAQNT